MRYRTWMTCLLAFALLFASVLSICKPMRVACESCASHVVMESVSATSDAFSGGAYHHLVTFAEAFPPAHATKLLLASAAMLFFVFLTGKGSEKVSPPPGTRAFRREFGDSIIADFLSRAFRRGILHAQIYA